MSTEENKRLLLPNTQTQLGSTSQMTNFWQFSMKMRHLIRAIWVAFEYLGVSHYSQMKVLSKYINKYLKKMTDMSMYPNWAEKWQSRI